VCVCVCVRVRVWHYTACSSCVFHPVTNTQGANYEEIGRDRLPWQPGEAQLCVVHVAKRREGSCHGSLDRRRGHWKPVGKYVNYDLVYSGSLMCVCSLWMKKWLNTSCVCVCVSIVGWEPVVSSDKCSLNGMAESDCWRSGKDWWREKTREANDNQGRAGVTGRRPLLRSDTVHTSVWLLHQSTSHWSSIALLSTSLLQLEQKHPSPPSSIDQWRLSLFPSFLQLSRQQRLKCLI